MMGKYEEGDRGHGELGTTEGYGGGTGKGGRDDDDHDHHPASPSPCTQEQNTS